MVARLRKAVEVGALDLSEFESRLEATYASKTVADLVPLTADLPGTVTPRPPAPARRGPAYAFRNGGFRWHFSMWAMTNGFLTGIWALSDFGGHFWPFYPAAGWGIGLGAHYLSAAQSEQRKQDRLARRSERHERVAERQRQHQERLQRHHQSLGPGAPPDESAPSAAGVTRRYVAAMFVDVVGSTELNETLGDEGWARVRDRFRALLHDCFASQGGEEVSVAGDGVLARFDHPAHAGRAAVEVQRRLERQREETGFAPSVRIGIHSGDVVADGDDVIGTVVNLASRVTDAAAANEILVTEHVADHLGDPLLTDDRGIHTLRGVSRPRHLLALRWR